MVDMLAHFTSHLIIIIIIIIIYCKYSISLCFCHRYHNVMDMPIKIFIIIFAINTFAIAWGHNLKKNCPLESVKVGLVEMVIQASEKDGKRILEYANNWKKGTSPVITGANIVHVMHGIEEF